MPAYNAAQTLRRTYDGVMAQKIVDQVIVVDNKSSDETVIIARKLPNVIVYSHDRNRAAMAATRKLVINWPWKWAVKL